MIESDKPAAAEASRPTGEMTVYVVPEGQRVSVGAPSLVALPNGKLLAAFDQSGPDVKGLSGKKGQDVRRGRWVQGRVMMSSDAGATWTLSATYPFRDASLFRDGGDLYVLGELSGGLCLMRSPDGGGSWSAPIDLSNDLPVVCSPTTVVPCGDWWHVPCLVPAGSDRAGLVVWRAARGASLMNRKAWTAGPVSPPLADWMPAEPGACGVPWPGATPKWRHPRMMPEVDGDHPWHVGGQLQLLSPAGCGREHWAVRVGVAEDGRMAPQMLEGDTPWLWMPLPGGHAKFDLIRDETTGRYWVAGSRGQTHLAVGRAAGHENGRHRLGVWSSANLAEWTLVAEPVQGGEGPGGIRCDPSLAIVGGDLVLVYRSGGPQSRRARETSQVLCSRVEQFRNLLGGR